MIKFLLILPYISMLALSSCDRVTPVSIGEIINRCENSMSSTDIVCRVMANAVRKNLARPLSVIFPSVGFGGSTGQKIVDTAGVDLLEFASSARSLDYTNANITMTSPLKTGSFKTLDGKVHQAICNGPVCTIDSTIEIIAGGEITSYFTDGLIYYPKDDNAFIKF